MRVFIGCLVVLSACSQTAVPEPPRTSPETQQLAARLDQQIERATKSIAAAPGDVALYSQRGDAYFFRGKFAEALADYDQMAVLEPRILPTHWRRGLALYYVGRYEDSAQQFEKSFELDQSDRENGIWRYYAQARQLGLEAARQKLLKYEQSDREPLPDIYRLCEGTLTPADLEQKLAAAASLPEADRSQREFYLRLYLGLDAALRNDNEAARRHLSAAVADRWSRQASYGTNYMWHIARLQLDLLPPPAEAAPEKEQPPANGAK